MVSSQRVLTSDCAQAYHVFAEVKDALSETGRGLVPEEEASRRWVGVRIHRTVAHRGYDKEAPTGVAIVLRDGRRRIYTWTQGFFESLDGHRSHQHLNLWNSSTRDSLVCPMKRTLRAFSKLDSLHFESRRDGYLHFLILSHFLNL